jgi:hypothetical protein
MPKIKNNKGMMALCTAAAITPDYRIAFLSIAGAQVAVKAIWASVIARRSVLHVGNAYRAITGDADVNYCLVKQTLAPGVHNWVLYPEPNPTAPYLLLIPLEGMAAQEQLVHVLNQHTLWPVKEEWGRVLWKRGTDTETKLIQELHTYGDLAWAYAVNPLGWDEVIDQAAKDGSLAFDQTSHGGEAQWPG